jgi:hypothetical protein
MSRPYRLTSPCAHCPFRSDIPPFLTRERVREIEHALERSEFPCHETTEHDDDGEYMSTREEAHCAGALILKEKLGESSQMMRIAERLGMYDPRKLKMDAPVYESFDEMAAACAGARPGRSSQV